MDIKSFRIYINQLQIKITRHGDEMEVLLV